jgi:hypothetical protein
MLVMDVSTEFSPGTEIRVVFTFERSTSEGYEMVERKHYGQITAVPSEAFDSHRREFDFDYRIEDGEEEYGDTYTVDVEKEALHHLPDDDAEKRMRSWNVFRLSELEIVDDND